MLFLELDTNTAKHLAAAIRAHRNWCRRSLIEYPSGLSYLEDALVFRLREGQGGPITAIPQCVSHDGLMLLLKVDDVAAALAVSESTVKRLIASGQLRTVTIGAARRVHRDDLEAFVDQQRTEVRKSA